MHILTDQPSLILEIDRSLGFNKERFGLQEYTIHQADESIEVVAVDMFVLTTTARYLSRTRSYPDMYVFASMWAQREELPEWLRRDTNNPLSFFQIYFPGTRLINRHKIECVLYLRWGPNYWVGPPDPRWHWGIAPIDYNWGYKFPNLVLDKEASW